MKKIDDDLEKAIQQSMLEVGKSGVNSNTFEAFNPNERSRERGMFVIYFNIIT